MDTQNRLRYSEIKYFHIIDKGLPAGIASYEVNHVQLEVLSNILKDQPICLTIKNQSKENPR